MCFNWFDVCAWWPIWYDAYCGYDGLTVCDFVYWDKSLGNQIVFCKQSCVQYAVKFVNAVPIIITCIIIQRLYN